MTLCDIPLLSEIAHERGALVVVDNTFASPYLQKPLALGADIVVHSTTKFLNGHSDSVGGIAVAKNPEHVEWLGVRSERLGSDPLAASTPGSCCAASRRSPSAWSGTRRTAARSRGFLATHPKVQKVYYPGLPDHPQHALAKTTDEGLRRDDLLRARLLRGGEAVSSRRCGSARSARASAASRR